MYGCVGRDGFAEPALELLCQGGVDVSGIREGEGATGCAMVCVDGAGKNQIVVASGTNLEVGVAQVSDAMLVPGNTVLLQLEVTDAENHALIKRARLGGACVLLNSAPARAQPDHVLAALDVLVVNEIEADMLADPLGEEGGDMEPAQALSRRLELAVVVTLGGRGALAFSPVGDWSIGALSVTPVDSTGAGDAFIGTLAAAMDGGADLAGALHPASVAGGARLYPGGCPDRSGRCRCSAAAAGRSSSGSASYMIHEAWYYQPSHRLQL